MPRLFVDLDGVLTDFDRQFEQWFGVRAPVALYKAHRTVKQVIDTHLVGAPPEFWTTMPWLPGAQEFWRRVAPWSPIVLSSPHFSPGCLPGKVAWVSAQLGPEAPAIFDTNKAAHGAPGDVLVDDTPENQSGWKGHFVLHRDWLTTLTALETALPVEGSSHDSPRSLPCPTASSKGA